MYQVGNSVEQVFGGTVIKQGDQTPLGFNFRDENGQLVNLLGSTIEVKMASRKGVVVEKQATISDGYTATFSLQPEDITGYGDMMIEFIVTYPDGVKEKFPSDNWQRIRITQTLEDVEKYGVGYITFEKLKEGFQDQFDGFMVDADERIESQKQRVDNLISNTPQPSEVVDARLDENGTVFTTLKNHLDNKGNKIQVLERNFVSVIQAPFNAKGDGFTIDQTALVKAVDYAYQNSKSLYFPDGVFVSDDNIPNFHKVKKFGPGIIKRGNDLFYITPQDGQTNKLYVSTSNSSNSLDGLSSSQAFRDLQVAVNVLPIYAQPILFGKWEFVLSSGTHLKRTVFPEGILSAKPIKISGADVGGHPNVPTTIIREGAAASTKAISANKKTQIEVSNILLLDFNGTTSSAGIDVSSGAKVYTDNVHATNCFYGISGVGQTEVVVPNGIFDNCGKKADGTGIGACIRSLQLNRHTIGIQNIGDRSQTAIFKNSRQAIWAQESSTGHVDWVTIQDCEDGLVARVNARINGDGTLFKRNKRDIRYDANGHVFHSSNVVHSIGADESENKLIGQSGGEITSSSIINGVEMAYTLIERSFGVNVLNQTIQTTSATKFKTLTLIAPLWRYKPTSIATGKKLFFRIYGFLTGTVGYKRVSVRLGTSVMNFTFNASETGSFEVEGYIYFTDTEKQLLVGTGYSHLGTVRRGRVDGTDSMNTNTDLSLEALVENTADSIKIDVCEIGWAG